MRRSGRRSREAEGSWLAEGDRTYYPPDSDEPHFDPTPAAERAIQWLVGLEQRGFVGAESRLKLVFDLLRQIVEGSEKDPRARIADLERRRDLLDVQIA